MHHTLHQIRRRATRSAIRGLLAGTARVPISIQHPIVRMVIALGGRVPMLRSRVAENMRLALGSAVRREAAGRYFDHLGWSFANALATFHRGLSKGVVDTVVYDASVSVLDDAVREGRGVVLASPHWIGHELLAAVVAQRHPMTMLVRAAPTADRMRRKLKWYAALGSEVVVRPMTASSIKDAVSYMKVLKRGRVLAITPDLLAGPGARVEATLFGRRATFHGGAFALAIAARAPIVCPSIEWQTQSRAVITFERLSLSSHSEAPDTAASAMQQWCRWFEDKLTANPENWLFWLDKRWSRFLRGG